jgi:anti-sigma-K factor RskA
MDHDAVDHREYEDMLAAAALGTLTVEEHERLRRHLRTCASCRAAYSRLLSAADTLPLTVEEREPSTALRERLRAQVGAPAWPEAPAAQPIPPGEPDIVPLPLSQIPEQAVLPTPPPRARRIAPGWIMIAAAMLLVGLVAGALIGRYLFVDDGEPAGQEVAMESPTGLPLDDASLTWLPEDEVLRFSAPDLPAPPEGQVYQVWLIAGEDQPPTPVGTVDSAGQFATTVDRDRFDTFAVTVEPGPLGSAEPSSDPVIVAPLE